MKTQTTRPRRQLVGVRLEQVHAILQMLTDNGSIIQEPGKYSTAYGNEVTRVRMICLPPKPYLRTEYTKYG